MAAPDPVDIRLLSLVAELGRAAVHDVAARLGMDPREVASRLVALSGTGLPLIVGVECDPHGLRNALAGAGPWLNYAAQGGTQNAHPQQSQYQPGQYQQAAYQQGAPRSPQQVQPGQQQPGQPGPAQQPQPGQQPGPARMGPPSGPFPVPFPAPGADPMATWGPPQSSAWARGDQPTTPAYPNRQARPAENRPADNGAADNRAADNRAAGAGMSGAGQPAMAGGASGGTRRGTVGDLLHTEGVDGGQVAVRLVEVVDPADFLFSAAGYRLREGERAVVVHTELSNRGSAPFPTLPDLYLMLVSGDGVAVGKAPVSLSSRPPHRIGVPPGDTAGGHTVYVLPEATAIATIRWSPAPDDDEHTLTWTVEP